MKNRHSRNGSTLVEVLVSLSILATTGVFVMGFLFQNPMSNKAWIDCYGHELSKIVLYTANIKNDTTILHIDSNGVPWETFVKQSQDEFETCYKIVSIRNKTDSTRALNYCIYGESK